MSGYAYRHVVGFEETNLVGNVYYANHIRWQGRAREMFVREFAPELLQELQQDLRIVTTRVGCDYFSELFAFDEVVIKMYAAAISQSRVSMHFDYFRSTAGGEELIAQGEQQVAFMRLQDARLSPIPVPEVLVKALRNYLYPG